jgi:hypothetical protein
MKKSIQFLVALLIIMGGAFQYAANAQMLADIRSDCATDFALYHPYGAEFTPQVPLSSVPADFSNVTNFQDFAWRFTAKDSSLLLQNHFTVKKSPYRQLFDVYNHCTWNGTPIFVTTDAVLHTYHVLFDRLLAEIETQHLFDRLSGLTEKLLVESASQLATTDQILAREAVYSNTAFLSVALKLLYGPDTDVPDTVSTLVNREIDLIEGHAGFDYSPILGDFSQMDYSQFKVRGHYTGGDTLQAFFKTMMWYGWTIFTMEPELFGPLSSRHTLQALLLVQMLLQLENDCRPLLHQYEVIYQPTAFFSGKTDDPGVVEYRTIAEQIYGKAFSSLSPDSLADPVLLDAFIAEVQKLHGPKIPNWIYGTYVKYKGFRFMGQRFIPDSYLFAHLVYPDVGTAAQQRWMPKALDVMAILGSEPAYVLLDSLYQEPVYEGYGQKIAEFNREFKELPAETWAQNLYWNWLYCLQPLLYDKGNGYPYFMQTRAWANKELMTALASWAELRHDTILYGKQSTTPCGIPPDPPKSYVEPNPHLYARLASLVDYTKTGLENFDLLIDGFGDKLDLFEALLLFLRDVSIKELENAPLTTEEYENIFCFGKAMQDLVSEYPDPQNPWRSNTDDMAVVADVHTDSNTDRCLEEGVGYPLEIFVIVNEGGYTRLTRGAVFAY